MKNVLFICLLAASAACPARDTTHFPKDVMTFIERRDACDHFRGEIASADEKKRLEEVIRKANILCRGTDKQLAKLRTKYARRVAIIESLKHYEDVINASAK
ncbi:MAG TPA: hypothetical protein VF800_02385 [Telluria sp.]|jgi:hypothetical protein